jgi:Transcriptional regulator, AbiEi antitoxin
VTYGRIAPISNTAMGKHLAALAARQHGVVSRGQLHKLGMSDSAIRQGLRAGRLHRVFHGVYAVGHSRIGERGRMLAATLVCGDGAVVSHRSAATLLGLIDRAPVAVDVIPPGQRGRAIDGVRVRFIGPLRPDETGTADGIPCTSPARTLVDNAGTAGTRRLRSMFERAAAKGVLDLDAVERSMSPRRPGAPLLRGLVAEWRPAVAVAATGRLKSPLEAMVLPLIVGRGLPAPRSNAPVRLASGKTIEVDFLWAEQRFVLEADSRDFHGTEVAFERDRWRDRELLRIGFAWLRATRLQAETEAEEIAATVAEKLTVDR